MIKKWLVLILLTVSISGCVTNKTTSTQENDYRYNIDLSQNVSISCAAGGFGWMVFPDLGVVIKKDLKGKEFDKELKITSFQYEVKKDSSKTYSAHFNDDLGSYYMPYEMKVNDEQIDGKWSDGSLFFMGAVERATAKRFGEPVLVNSKQCMVHYNDKI
ncbi:hypothetical protein [Rheinheimera oceanensis]|uniref:hypothetical protein n=1 Tax=Rheinheimera oceanensis TaxID=2817449 RepID=UPI001BFCEED5|nr:hypothetical protein [Rheinheimera oceanensis]